ncbi:transposase, MuDR, MULE transposase domain protein [Tanacetum coccineum]
MVNDDDDLQFFVNELCSLNDVVQKLIIKLKCQASKVTPVPPPLPPRLPTPLDFNLNVSLLPLSNEGTVTHIQTDEQSRFEMLFVGFGIAVQSFVWYLRPLIIIDVVHLKGSYKGTNLLAVGMDGNNQILPIAMGVTHGETGASWTWFMTRLKECISEVSNLCIISDRHPAIILACKKIRGMYGKTCKAYTTHEFDALLAVLKLPVTRLVEYFRGLLQRWYCDKRQKYEDAPADELTPWAAAKVKDRMLKSQNTSTWEAPNYLQQVLPPLMLKQPAGRPKNINRILSRGETPSQAGCGRCGIRGLNRNSCTQLLPSNQEHLTREALLDEERLRNGRIYQDWDDLVQEEPNTSRKRRSNVNSCPP